MKCSWKYFIILNETKYGLSNIVENIVVQLSRQKSKLFIMN